MTAQRGAPDTMIGTHSRVPLRSAGEATAHLPACADLVAGLAQVSVRLLRMELERVSSSLVLHLRFLPGGAGLYYCNCYSSTRQRALG